MKGIDEFILKLKFHVERANAEEFHEVYKGVVNDYKVSLKRRISLNISAVGKRCRS